DQEVAEVVHAGGDRARLAFERTLPPADEAGVGLEPHEDVGAVRLGRQGDAEDLPAGDADPRADPPERLAPGESGNASRPAPPHAQASALATAAAPGRASAPLAAIAARPPMNCCRLIALAPRRSPEHARRR